MGTRKNKKSNKRFRKTRSKRQSGGAGKGNTSKKFTYDISGEREEEEENFCTICGDSLDNSENVVTTYCGHRFHNTMKSKKIKGSKDCLPKWCKVTDPENMEKLSGNTPCPICRFNISFTCKMLPLLPQLSDKEINLLNGIEYGDIPLITQSLDNTNANMIGPQNTTPLLIAIYNAMKMYNDEDRTRGDPERDIEIVKMLLEKGANVNETDERVRTAFLVAAWRGRKRIVEVLLEQEVDVDTTVPTTKFGGWTALIAVSVQGNPDIVKLLLDNGADMNAKDEKGNTALFHASGRGHAEIVEMLLDNEADMNAKDKNGQTALIEASEKGHAEIVVMLLEKGVNMNVDDNHVKVALITASGRGHKRVVEVLLDKGVDVNAIDTTFAGWTPLITASVRGYAEIVAMLLTRDGILVNAGDEHGRTALIFASNNGYIDIVKLLLDNGANVNAEDKGGNTALIFASNKGHTDIMELLKRPNLPPPPPPKGGKRKSRKSNKFNKKRT